MLVLFNETQASNPSTSPLQCGLNSFPLLFFCTILCPFMQCTMSQCHASGKPNLSGPKSPFQARSENVMRFPFGGGNSLRGVNHTLLLIQRACQDDASSLHPDYSPIMVLRCLHTNVSRRNVNILKLSELVMKINGSDHFDGHLERPLVIAASLGRRG